MTAKYLCNLIVPGAAKSGTSSLHEALNKHPKISMSEQKEPHYFCRSEKYAQGCNYHNGLFSPDDAAEFFGESSTGYMIWSDAVERIARDLTNPKIILLLRHPVERTISHWKWRVKLGLEGRPIMAAIEANGYGFDPEKPDNGYGYMSYLQFSEYSKYCSMWIEQFGKENCLTITTDDLRTKFQNTMSKCFSFLDLDNFVFKDEVKSNETRNLVGRPQPFMTKMMSPLPSNLKKTYFYRNIRDYILRMQTSKKEIKVSDNDIKAIEILLKKEIEYFDMVKNS